jgi:pimeloyl-ACP methyl ester carboxylesterase
VAGPATPPEPLLLLPGLMCDADSWAPQRAAFAPGRPTWVAEYGAADTLADMAGAVLAQAPPLFALAGHSMGARVALEIIDRAPQRVTRLALLDTGTHALQPGETERRYALLQLGRDHGIDSLVSRWLPPMLAGSVDPAGALMQGLRAMVIRAGLAGYERQIRALLGRRDAAPLLAAVTCPILLGVGELDGWSPPAQHRQMAAMVPHARLVVFPGAGHMAPVEAPDAVIAAMQHWLDDTGSTGPSAGAALT